MLPEFISRHILVISATMFVVIGVILYQFAATNGIVLWFLAVTGGTVSVFAAMAAIVFVTAFLVKIGSLMLE